jgi:tetratricopeptide (TPR) repeat protein
LDGVLDHWTIGKADEYADAALRLGPHDTLAYVYFQEKGVGLFTLSHYDEATNFFKRAITINRDYAVADMMLTASLALSGHDVEAIETLRRYLALPLDIPKTIAQIKARQPYLRDYYGCLYEGLRKAGMQEGLALAQIGNG